MPPKLKIFFHDNCFDGASSAALFADFYRSESPSAEVELEGVQHRAGDPFEGRALDGDDNACLDFRYCADPRMTWWFDHHVSAFQPASLRRDFEANPSPQRVYDPESPSCAMLIRRTLEERWGFAPRDPEGSWAELLEWADRIDAARFRDATEAVELAAPALQLMTWFEHNTDPALTDRAIRMMGHRPLAEIAAEPWVREPLVPIIASHRDHIDLVRRRAEKRGDIVLYDLAGDGVWAHNKFIAYMLFPECRYTVGVTSSRERAKVSVGSNPWSPRPRTHDIASICERFGGGGHPVVGAVSLPASELERARAIAAEIVESLSDQST